MTDPDHIVIGSGINALVAAAMLSKAGKRVLVLEREDRLGGCILTDEITLPGFRHDVMSATWVLFVTGPAMEALGEDLSEHGLEFCHSGKPTAALRPNGEALVLTTDRAANVAAFDAAAAGDGARHKADVETLEAEAPFIFGLLGGPLWSGRTLKLLAQQAWKRGLRGLAAWFGDALRPSRAWLSGYGPAVQALWAPWVLHVGLTPESAYGAKMGHVVAFALEAAGAPVVKGGGGAAVDAFRKMIEANGGTLRTGADVERILTANGKVTGVRLAGGETIDCTSVLASVAPGQLADRLLADTDAPREKAGAEAFRHGRGNFQLHFALDAEPDWIAEGLEDVALIHLTDGIDAVSKSCNEAERGMIPETPTICVGQPHRLDPTRCPDGKAVLWLQIPDAPVTIKGDAAREIATDPTWTQTMREAYADRIEGILARHIRNWDDIKLARRAYSPADLEAMNINLVGGDPYGGAAALDQFFLWRPFKHSVNTSTPITGLRHIGASVHPGPGLNGGSGVLAARALGA